MGGVTSYNQSSTIKNVLYVIFNPRYSPYQTIGPSKKLAMTRIDRDISQVIIHGNAKEFKLCIVELHNKMMQTKEVM